jgi:hypothetical protein
MATLDYDCHGSRFASSVALSRRHRTAVLVLAVGALIAVPASAIATAFVGPVGGAEVRPGTLYLSADGTLVMKRVRWTTWGGSSADGRGIIDYHGCTPNCGTAPEHSQVATVVLSRVVACHGHTYYTLADIYVTKQRKRRLFASVSGGYATCS